MAGGDGTPTDPKPTDPNFANVLLLLKGNNTGSPSTIINSGNTSDYSVTLSNNSVTNSTNFPKFDTGSLLFDSAIPSYLNCVSTAFNVGSQDCTIECFFRLTGDISQNKVLFEMRPDNINGAFPLLSTKSNNLAIYFNSVNPISVAPTIVVDTYYYVAVRKTGTTTELWLDGTKLADFVSNDWSGSGRILLGRLAFDFVAPYTRLNGYIDEFRFTLGVARDVSAIPTSGFLTS